MGYTGGLKVNPTYYSLGDHTETVDIDYDPEVTSYENMLALFWKHHDPTNRTSQQYKSVIFYHDVQQEKLARESLKEAQQCRSKKIATVIVPATQFYEAEKYHQKYMMQQHPILMSALNVVSITSSHLCTRVNGYLGANGKTKDFDQEWEILGLNENMAEYIRCNMLKNRHGRF